MKTLLIIPVIFISFVSMAQHSENSASYCEFFNNTKLTEIEKNVDHNRVEFGEVFNSDNKTVQITWTLWYAANNPGNRIVNDMDVHRNVPIDKVRQFEDSIRVDAEIKFKFLDSLRK